MLEPMDPLLILITLFQALNVFFGTLNFIKICDLAYFERRKFMTQLLLRCLELADPLVGFYMTVLHSLELFCILIWQRPILFYQSILKVIQDSLHLCRVVILLLNEFALRFYIVLYNANIGWILIDLVLKVALHSIGVTFYLFKNDLLLVQTLVHSDKFLPDVLLFLESELDFTYFTICLVRFMVELLIFFW